MKILATNVLNGRRFQVSRLNSGEWEVSIPDQRGDESTWWLASSLVDVQVNGYAGVDFQSSNVSECELLHAVRSLRRDGCAFFCLTLITDAWSSMLGKLRRFKSMRESNPELRHSILGWHLEGPFLSPLPGFRGAHSAEFMEDPTLNHLDELKQILGDDYLLMTLAPERPGGIEFIRAARQRGVVISLGHTNADSEHLRLAFEAGAQGLTHVGNAIPQEIHRHENVLWKLMDSPADAVSMIPDGIHLPPDVFRCIWKCIGSRRVFFTTDAMAAAGAPPGRYRIGKMEVEVGDDQIVRQPGHPHFAGSALRPIDGVFRAAKMLEIPWQTAWGHSSNSVTRLMVSSASFQTGSKLEYHLLNVTQDGVCLEHFPITVTEKAAELLT